jgi:hypothetical protein
LAGAEPAYLGTSGSWTWAIVSTTNVALIADAATKIRSRSGSPSPAWLVDVPTSPQSESRNASTIGTLAHPKERRPADAGRPPGGELTTEQVPDRTQWQQRWRTPRTTRQRARRQGGGHIALPERADIEQGGETCGRQPAGRDRSALSRTHREIFHLIGLFGRLVDDLPASGPDDGDHRDLRRVLYSLHAILELHMAQEEELYVALGESGRDGLAVARPA